MRTTIILKIVIISSALSFKLEAQHIPTVSKPNWVKNITIPYDTIDSLGYPIDLFYSSEIYREVQINFDTEEIYTKKLLVAPENKVKNSYEVDLRSSPKDEVPKIISISLVKDSIEPINLNELNWSEKNVSEYVANKLWDSEKTICISINSLQPGDRYILSSLKKSLRQDASFYDGILLYSPDSLYVHYRVISSKPLYFKAYNGSPEIKEIKHESYYEYLAKNFAVTPYKGEVPKGFMGKPFCCFSQYRHIDEMAPFFRKMFVVDDKSREMLDELHDRLTHSLSNDSLRIRNILNYVQDTIVYKDYGLVRAYQPSWCIEGKRGDCKAKSLIAIELLKRSGIQAYPVLVKSPHYYTQLDSIPSGYSFNHVIVQYILKEDTILVDPTAFDQTDKIGAYPVLDYGKGLVIFDNKVEWKAIGPTNFGKVLIYDNISDTVQRKLILSGFYAENYNQNKSQFLKDKTLFDSDILGFYTELYTIFDLESFSPARDGIIYSTIQEDTYNTISKDSLVFTQHFYKNNRNQNLLFRKQPRGKTFSSFTKDSVYTGAWPLNYVNQSTVTKLDKQKVTIDEKEFDNLNTNFSLKSEFGHYRCTIEETRAFITLKQDVYIYGRLPLDEWNAYERFMDKIWTHIENINKIIKAKRLVISE